ncbi:hypothetical protein ACFQ3S_02945 [Mucilaginibacter terrae]|uniref:hypothetical protein n=1 Tax=Mucilaginibacter terrae TaxID=1955052 RepID=UPI003628EB51
MMKNIYGVFILVLLLFTGGCKQDEAIVPSTLQNINLLGKWYLKQLEIIPVADPASSTVINNFTSNDFFEFKTGNAATYSSTLYAKVFEGYYSANSLTNPQTLSFKSGDLLLKYFIDSLDPLNELVLYETLTTTEAGITTSTRYQYTYNRLP